GCAYICACIGILCSARSLVPERRSRVRESKVEEKLRIEAKRRGGWAVKFVSPGLDGVPDRLVLFPGGRLAFVEVKAPGKKMGPLQEFRARQPRALGFRVYCFDCIEKIGGILDEIQCT